MKKWKTLFIGMLSGLLLFAGCGKSYDAKTSTVYVLKEGKSEMDKFMDMDDN